MEQHFTVRFYETSLRSSIGSFYTALILREVENISKIIDIHHKNSNFELLECFFAQNLNRIQFVLGNRRGQTPLQLAQELGHTRSIGMLSGDRDTVRRYSLELDGENN